MRTPLVSICCITYNHEKYIRECLDGFVMQKTTFPIEVVISDDCSSDNTRAFIAEYKLKFPNLIRDVSPEHNLGAVPNFIYVQKQAKGKYIAICEGDDYWIDPYKLQKQVNFMESHDDYVACFHNARVFNGQTYCLFNDVNENHFPKAEDIILRRWFIATPTLLFRRDENLYPDWSNNVVNGDYLLNLLLAREGKFYYMDDAMAVYRKEGQGISVFLNAHKLDLCDKLISLLQSVKEIYPDSLSSIFDLSISNYKTMKEEYQRELFYKRYPIMKMFRLKTYKRAIKEWMRKYV